MSRPGNEIAGRWKRVALRAANCRRKSYEISRRDQHDGLTQTDRDGAWPGEHRRNRAGNSAYSQSKTADGPARRFCVVEARNSSAARAAEISSRGRLSGNLSQDRQWWIRI